MQWANPSTPAVAPKVISNQPVDKKKHPTTWFAKTSRIPTFPFDPQQDCDPGAQTIAMRASLWVN